MDAGTAYCSLNKIIVLYYFNVPVNKKKNSLYYNFRFTVIYIG